MESYYQCYLSRVIDFLWSSYTNGGSMAFQLYHLLQFINQCVADETYQKLQIKLFAINQLFLVFWEDVFCSVSVWSLLILDSLEPSQHSFFILSLNRSAKIPNYYKFHRNPRITYFQPSPCTSTKLHESFLITTWNSIQNY